MSDVLGIACGFLLSGAALGPDAAHPTRDSGDVERVQVHVDTREAEAVLSILAARAGGEPVTESMWTDLFASPGYVRLKNRESDMGREFTDDSFRAFVLSDSLLDRAAALRETLDRWSEADGETAARLALAYLPAAATIQATVLPVIKPVPNSFVYDVKTDPAIFLFLDPALPRAAFINTMAHELHHIGYGSTCPTTETERAASMLSDEARVVIDWLGAFGEGFAMLAAAGGADIHPHAASPVADRVRWDRDVANAEPDLHRVEQFLLDILDGRLKDPDDVRGVGFSFFGVQGPWYTVGWLMAVTIERALGREALIAAFCDPASLLATYNESARRASLASTAPLPTWSDALLHRLKVPR